MAIPPLARLTVHYRAFYFNIIYLKPAIQERHLPGLP